MGDGMRNMEGVSQSIRPSKQSNNSPTRPRQGNNSKSLAKGKNGQIRPQKFIKGGLSCGYNPKNVSPGQHRTKNTFNPQKNGHFTDKRPAAKGLKQTAKYDPVSVEDDEMQLDYDFCLTSKKNSTSLNHLLNFTYTSFHHTRHSWHSGKHTATSKWNQFNKEQFIQANCQFVIKEGGDYAVNCVNPDVIVDWDLIKQVRVRCREMPFCPICLYPPTAAQMTRCGHIYCWSCILHYLSLSGKSWRKCPLCYEAIHKDSLTSVMAVADTTRLVGEEITMSLMKRARDSVFALPKEEWVEHASVPNLTAGGVELQFSKLLVASSSVILNQIMTKDKLELQQQLVECQNEKSGEEEYVKLAIKQFEEKEKTLMAECNTDVKENVFGRTKEDMKEISTFLEENSDATMNSSLEAKGILPNDGEHQHVGSRVSRTSASSDDSYCSSIPSGDTHYYYFYQAEDGQYIFLHQVNARCLIKEYGSLENCPSKITGRIVEMESHTQTEEIRRRFRYLRHLPLTCEFVICELELKPPIVSLNTLNFFKNDLRKCRLRRLKKAKEEAKHDSKCKSSMTEFTGIKIEHSDNVETPDLESEKDFPQQFQQVDTSCNMWIASSPPTHGPWSSNRTTNDEENETASSSFAKVLSSGKTKTPTSCSSKLQTQSCGSRSSENEKNSEEENDEYQSIPSFQSSFTNALLLGELNIMSDEESSPPVNGRKRGKGKRNKKKEKRLLFSTDSAMKL
ncbi:RING finger protein 10-like [Xenia sp. Carnegie-2017]|uniref:RING finger protein 10-like n=1 Tax=Xenia sp. Carnegie-2017 TaxID=2897299 RepID=UPI001F04C6A8|nr:RING finger protein 10-like [Xenia sp. Carnegie-2017]